MAAGASPVSASSQRAAWSARYLEGLKGWAGA